jgi:hypothetical protein
MDLAKRVADRHLEAVIRKEKGEYCVRSPDNPDWSGGCYPTKEEAKKRLQQVEFFKHKKAYEPEGFDPPAEMAEAAYFASREAIKALLRNFRYSVSRSTLKKIQKDVQQVVYNGLRR